MARSSSGIDRRFRRGFALGAALCGLAFAATALRAAPGEESRVVVEYWEKWAGEEAEVMRGIVDDFNRSQDRIFVRMLTVSRIDQKMMLAVAGRVPPDIVGLWLAHLTSYVQNSALLPLDTLARDAGIKEEDYIPVYWQMCRREGFLWALPTTPTVTALHWNKKLFREAGLDPERPPRTIAELEEFNEKLTKRGPDGELIRVGHMPQEPGWWMRDFNHWFGGPIWDGGGRLLLLDDPPARDFFDWAASYPHRFGGTDMNSLRGAFGNFSSPENPFFTGKVAMVMQGVWMDNFIRQYAPPDFEYGVAAFPSAEDGVATVGVAECDILVIPSGARHPREAMEFLAYIQRPAVMEKLCLGQKKFTPLREVSPEFLAAHPHPFLRKFIELAKSPDVRPILSMPTLAEYTNDLTTYINLVLLGRMSPDEARAALQTRQQKALDKKTARWERVREKRLAEWRAEL